MSQPPNPTAPTSFELICASFDTSQLKQLRRFVVQYIYRLDPAHEPYFKEQDSQIFFDQMQVPIPLQQAATLWVALIYKHLKKIDVLIKNNSKNWNFSRIGKVELSILRVGIAEMLLRPSLPETIIYADTAEIAKEFGMASSNVFVNGILNVVCKELKSGTPDLFYSGN